MNYLWTREEQEMLDIMQYFLAAVCTSWKFSDVENKNLKEVNVVCRHPA